MLHATVDRNKGENIKKEVKFELFWELMIIERKKYSFEKLLNFPKNDDSPKSMNFSKKVKKNLCKKINHRQK